MLGLIDEFVTLCLVLGPFVLPFWLPIVPVRKRLITNWEAGAIAFGLVSGPLLLMSIPKNAGFGAIVPLAIYDLMLPVWSITIARTTRPFLFALAGSSGYFASFVYLYIAYPSDTGTMGPTQIIPLIFAWIAGPALFMAIPFYIRIKILRKRNRISLE